MIEAERVGKLVKLGAVLGEQREILLTKRDDVIARRPIEGVPGVPPPRFKFRE